MGFFQRHDASTIIDGCNSLLLYYASRPPAFHVVNPTTRRRAALPAPLARALLSVLSFDPCASLFYKVLCFVGTSDAYPSRHERWNGAAVPWPARSQVRCSQFCGVCLPPARARAVTKRRTSTFTLTPGLLCLRS
jgi:hypothetical protein